MCWVGLGRVGRVRLVRLGWSLLSSPPPQLSSIIQRPDLAIDVIRLVCKYFLPTNSFLCPDFTLYTTVLQGFLLREKYLENWQVFFYFCNGLDVSVGSGGGGGELCGVVVGNNKEDIRSLHLHPPVPPPVPGVRLRLREDSDHPPGAPRLSQPEGDVQQEVEPFNSFDTFNGSAGESWRRRGT